MTILIVEDHDVLRKLYAVRFKDLDVLFAKDGEEALEVLRHTSPDVILLDLNMPGMNGIEFLSKKMHRCPVVIVTNVNNRIPYEEWESKHIKEFLIKNNTSLKKVEEVIRNLLK